MKDNLKNKLVKIIEELPNDLSHEQIIHELRLKLSKEHELINELEAMMKETDVFIQNIKAQV